MRNRRPLTAVTLWVLFAWSSACSSYQRTPTSALKPGKQSVGVTFPEPRTVDVRLRNDSVGTATVARLYGKLERVSGDTLYVRPTNALDARGRQVPRLVANAPIAIAVTDAERIEAYRFSGGRSAAAVAGTLFVAFVLVAASACIMCDFGGSSY